MIELVSLCEQLKVKLCRSINTDKAVNYKLPPKSISEEVVEIATTDNLKSKGVNEISLSFIDFNSIMLDYWDGVKSKNGIKTTIDKAIHDASLSINDIDKAIITGGGGRNPYIKNLVTELFINSIIIIPDNIQEQVARGVALQSFVLNSFGKNIITPILSDDIYIEGENKVVVIFKAGISIPSEEIEIDILEKQLQNKRYILSYLGKDKKNIKYFEIPENEKIEKLIFYIAPDQELKCEIIYSNFVKEANEFFEVQINNLIKIK